MILLFFMLVALRLFLGSFLVMLVAGALHNDVSASMPALSYPQSILVSIALSLLGSYFYQPTTES